jgi:predicted  nucleic acid-binding Zn-ribbon protein
MKCYAYDNADKRRRDRRQALTEAYNREHGIADLADQPRRPVLSMKSRKPVDRVQAAVNPINFDYREQISKAAEHHSMLAQKAEEKLSRQYQKMLNESGRKIHAVQKVRGKSIPLI